MPTRPQIWRFRAIYDGFEHGGLRAEVDRDKSTPLNRAGRVARLEGFVCDEDGRRVGQFTRMLASGGEGFRVRHEKVELDPAARGRGFARAMHQHAEDNYRRMEVLFIPCTPRTSARCCGRGWALTSTCAASRATARPSGEHTPC